MNHKRVYELLKSAGHSPIKAMEIIFDARRNDQHALAWIRILFAVRSSLKGIQ